MLLENYIEPFQIEVLDDKKTLGRAVGSIFLRERFCIKAAGKHFEQNM